MILFGATQSYLYEELCTRDLAVRVLGDLISNKVPLQITPELILTKTSEWWFNKLEQDLNVPHHHLYSHNNVMFVKKCNVIPLEVVIRDYMTGSTKTSLWTHYKNGSRNYSGNILRHGYVKNQKLDNAIITPSTKEEYGKHDQPISKQEIINQTTFYFFRKKVL